jgi:HlyD family secretion protein
VATAQSQLAQRRSEKTAALAYVRQCQADLDNARNHARRSAALVAEGAISRQTAQDNESRVLSAEAVLASARAQVSAAEAAIATAETQVIGAQSTIEAAQATVERIQADLDDSLLKSPRDGRIQYRIAQPGEVLGAGGRVLSLVDLSDVYMTFFLPTAAAGRIALGSEVRLVLDAAPLHVIPAKISFISDVAQFTPKTVETASEREKLMFRVRAQLPVELLKKYITQVKTGLPGMAYVLIDPQAQWPENLRVTVTP